MPREVRRRFNGHLQTFPVQSQYDQPLASSRVDSTDDLTALIVGPHSYGRSGSRISWIFGELTSAISLFLVLTLGSANVADTSFTTSMSGGTE